mmetsp:Transcript_15524/g.47344  ORF Transcript_15524/g.47344 Transcript_15524/m.47344 type:complete len:235 (-) Transcript_15524:1600-2304(-)
MRTSAVTASSHCVRRSAQGPSMASLEASSTPLAFTSWGRSTRPLRPSCSRLVRGATPLPTALAPCVAVCTPSSMRWSPFIVGSASASAPRERSLRMVPSNVTDLMFELCASLFWLMACTSEAASTWKLRSTSSFSNSDGSTAAATRALMPSCTTSTLVRPLQLVQNPRKPIRKKVIGRNTPSTTETAASACEPVIWRLVASSRQRAISERKVVMSSWSSASRLSEGMRKLTNPE